MSSPGNNERRRTVLLIEDNPTDVFVIRHLLGELNIALHVLEDGSAAQTYFGYIEGDSSADCPALILLDLNLPKVPGVEVLRQIRGARRCSDTPVIVVSSSDAAEDRKTAEELRVEAYFQKPNDLTSYRKLAELVDSVLHRTQKQRLELDVQPNT